MTLIIGNKSVKWMRKLNNTPITITCIIYIKKENICMHVLCIARLGIYTTQRHVPKCCNFESMLSETR